MSMDYQEAAALLREKDQILILTHRRPDGDTIGCAAGLCRAGKDGLDPGKPGGYCAVYALSGGPHGL